MNNTNNTQSTTYQQYPGVRETSLPPLPQKERRSMEQEVQFQRTGRGCMPGCGCKSIACGGCFFIILLIIGFVFLVINKPSFFWDPFVNFMNNGIELPVFEEVTSEEAKDSINGQIKSVGENEITISEAELTALVKQRIPDLKNPKVDIEPDNFRIYFEADSTNPENPLYALVEVKDDGTKAYFSKFGTGRVVVPDFANEAITKLVISRISNVQNENENYSILYNFLAPDSSVTLSKLSLGEDELKITITVSADLFK